MKNYTRAEVAKLLNLGRNTVERMVRLREIGSISVGRKTYITQEHIDKYLEDLRTKKRYSIAKARIELGVTDYAMRGIIERGDIVPIKIGERTYITQAQIDTYLKEVETEATWEDAVEEETDLIRRINDELARLGVMHLTEREEILVDALGRVLSAEVKSLATQ